MRTAKSMRRLDVSNNNLGGEAATHIAAALEDTTTLRSLRIHGNRALSLARAPHGAGEAFGKALAANGSLLHLEITLGDSASGGTKTRAPMGKKKMVDSIQKSGKGGMKGKAGKGRVAAGGGGKATNATGFLGVFRGLNVNSPAGGSAWRSLALRGAVLSQSACTLAGATARNRHLTSLDISDAYMGPQGAQALVDGLLGRATGVPEKTGRMRLGKGDTSPRRGGRGGREGREGRDGGSLSPTRREKKRPQMLPHLTSLSLSRNALGHTGAAALLDLLDYVSVSSHD